MIIKFLTLFNFKNFRGKNVIDLTPDPKNGRNIILIGGKNGAGKTAILEAINVCLLGKHFNGNIVSRNNYEKYIRSLLNKTAIKKEGSKFYIEIELEINEAPTTYTLELKREWTIRKSKIKEQFFIMRDEVPLEIIPREYWEDYIISMIPPYISEFFFFDGEKVKDLASGHNADVILKESIRDAIGLNIHEALYRDVEKLIKKTSRKNIRQKALYDELSKEEKELKKIRHNLDKIQKYFERNEKIIEGLWQKKDEIEKELKRTAGFYALERKRNEDTLLNAKEKLSKAEDNIKEICGNILPFIIASSVCFDLVKQLRNEKRLKELIASKNILHETQTKLIKRLDSDKELLSITKIGVNKIKRNVETIFSDMLKNIQYPSKKDIIHDLTPSETELVLYFLNKTEQNLEKKFTAYLEKRGKQVLDIKKINEKLAQVPDDVYIKEYIKNISSIQTQLELLEKENLKLKDKEISLNDKLNSIQESINEIEEKIVASEEANRKIELSILIQKILQDYLNYSISTGVEELEDAITKMYCKLANKEDMVKNIIIDKKSFCSKLSNSNGEVINKENISAGEKEIYALSLLWGLSKVSNRQLPIIIDSPLSKLDSSHVANIVKEYFPRAAKQVVILSHDREIDRKTYNKLKPKISKEYTLSLSEVKKISKGYFENSVNVE